MACHRLVYTPYCPPFKNPPFNLDILFFVSCYIIPSVRKKGWGYFSPAIQQQWGVQDGVRIVHRRRNVFRNIPQYWTTHSIYYSGLYSEIGITKLL